MYGSFRHSEHAKFVFDVARRVGKSYTMCLIGIEDCLRRPRAMVKYGAATQEMVREIVIPLAQQIAEDAPDSLRPVWKPTENAFVFHNGSRMKVVGLETHADRLRGTALDTALIDEAAFVAELEYVVQSILVPQMQGRAWSRILLGSTPPKSPSHKWSTRYVPEARANGAYVHRTIMDNPRLSQKERDFFINEAGGPEAVENLRENFAQHIVDEDSSIIPEFAKAEKDIVVTLQKPKYFDAYVSMDPGFTDLTVVLFGYYDFERAKLCIEDEISLSKTNTVQLASLIKAKEQELWSNYPTKHGKSNPHLRVSDVELRLIADLNMHHGISFIPTPKDGKEAAINALRTAVWKRDIQIDERCKVLLSHLRFGVWNKSRTSFERSGDYGHFDAIDALIYMVRNVPKYRNPFPLYGPEVTPATHFTRPGVPGRTSLGTNLKKAFQKRRWG